MCTELKFKNGSYIKLIESNETKRPTDIRFKEITENRREEAIKYIEAQLEDGYLDLGLHDQDELEIIKEAMKMLKFIDKWNSIPLN